MILKSFHKQKCLARGLKLNNFLLLFSVLSNHTANNHYGRLELESPGYQTAASLQPLHENSRQEKIEVQILPGVRTLRTIYDLE